MNTTAPRELIQQAHLSEVRHDHLADLIVSHLPRLHRTIQPRGENTEDTLTRFAYIYVEQVPDLLDATNSVAREVDIEKRIEPVLEVAEQPFLTPSALFAGHDGLDVLFGEAYLAHRLVEEVNDHYITHSGQAPIPLDTTVASLVVRQLIGEFFANRLNEAVRYAVENMLNATTFDADPARAHRENLKNPRVVAAWQQWPCPLKQLRVEFNPG